MLFHFLCWVGDCEPLNLQPETAYGKGKRVVVTIEFFGYFDFGYARESNQNMILSRLKKFVHYYKEGGFYALAKVLSLYHYIPYWLFYTQETYIVALDNLDQVSLPQRERDYDISLADSSHLHQLVSCDEKAIPGVRYPLFSDRFERGDLCAAAIRDGEIIGYIWATSSHYTDTYNGCKSRLTIAPDRDSVFTGPSFTHPSHRGKGIAPTIKYYLMKQYPAGKRFYTAIDALNQAPLRANAKLGFQRTATIRCYSFFYYGFFYLRREREKNWQYLGRGSILVNTASFG